MTERADQLHHDDAPAQSASHHPGLSAPLYSPDLVLYDFWLFPKLKSPLKGRRFVNATVTQYTRSVNGVSLLTD